MPVWLILELLIGGIISDEMLSLLLEMGHVVLAKDDDVANEMHV